MVAGIIVFAVGGKGVAAQRRTRSAMRRGSRSAAASRSTSSATPRSAARLLGPPGPVPAAGVVALLVLYAVTGDLAAWAVAVAVALVLVGVCAVTRSVGPEADRRP